MYATASLAELGSVSTELGVSRESLPEIVPARAPITQCKELMSA